MPNAYITLNICFLLATCCHHHMYHSMKWSHRNTKCWTGWRDPADSGLLPLPHRVLNMAFGVFSGAYNTAKVRQLYGNTRRRMWYRCAVLPRALLLLLCLGVPWETDSICNWYVFGVGMGCAVQRIAKVSSGPALGRFSPVYPCVYG